MPGHARHTSSLEKAVGFTLLIDRLDSGEWGDTSVAALLQLGNQIATASTIDLGEMNFFDPGQLASPLNTWDVSNWGSYQRK